MPGLAEFTQPAQRDPIAEYLTYLETQFIPGLLGKATGNPLMMGKAARQRQGRTDATDIFGYGPSWESYAAGFGRNMRENFPTQDAEAVKQAAFRSAMNAGPLATVFHGSPHLFDKFDMSKVGTGEGAQSYGRGLYFAENPDVALHYQQKLSPHTVTQAQAMELADKMGRPWAQMGAFERRAFMDEIAKNPEAFSRTVGGNLYKVDLPDDQIAKMVYWDKPINQQPENVRAVLSELSRETSPARVFGDNSAGDVIKAAIRLGLEPEKRLKAAGAPGIRYLDQGSRDVGQGTFNFVVFDDTIPTILGRE